MKPLTKSRFNPREQILIALSILVVNIGILKLWYVPQKNKLNELKSEVSGLQVLLNNNRMLLTQIKTQSVPTTANESVEKHLALNNNFALLLKGLGGDGVDFTVNRLAVEEHQLLSGYTKTLFTLDVDTSFLTLGQFIEKLESSQFLLEIQSIDISRVSQELKKCTAKIRLYSYVARSS